MTLRFNSELTRTNLSMEKSASQNNSIDVVEYLLTYFIESRLKYYNKMTNKDIDILFKMIQL